MMCNWAKKVFYNLGPLVLIADPSALRVVASSSNIPNPKPGVCLMSRCMAASASCVVKHFERSLYKYNLPLRHPVMLNFFPPCRSD